MNIYLIIMFAAVAAGFALAASISIGAYKEYIGNDLIKKENSEDVLKGKFIVLASSIFTKVMYAAVIFLMTKTSLISVETMKLPVLAFSAAAFITMLLQGIVLKKETLAGALDDANMNSKLIIKVMSCEAICVLAFIYIFLSFG